ncbi:nucleotidyltransferase family protein [Rhizobium sp. Rhizsp42]|uniref:nucleotidyltransferase family protein n=1 Tax=Rhizobium sp. Rhizsp42 TaxID=3243034 RepID=UPI0039B0DA68
MASVTIVILAAGTGARMGGQGNKLLAEFDGVPLVRRLALTALASEADSVHVVVGNCSEAVRGALVSVPVQFTENPHYGLGMSTSLKAGLAIEDVRHSDGVLVMLADMPLVTSVDLDRLIGAFKAGGGSSIIRAVSGSRPGNPVILPKSIYGVVAGLSGDIGARRIIDASSLAVVEVDIGDAAMVDADTPEAIEGAGGRVVASN